MRQQAEGSASPEVLIVDLKNGNNVMRRPIKADSAIMHWNKAGHCSQGRRKDTTNLRSGTKEQAEERDNGRGRGILEMVQRDLIGPGDGHERLPLEHLRPCASEPTEGL